mgnify:CR=1 FL=1
MFFASIREITGTPTIGLRVATDTRISGLRKELIKRYPNLECNDTKCAIAVNQEYVSDDRVLEAGDEVALIPPVSGG